MMKDVCRNLETSLLRIEVLSLTFSNPDSVGLNEPAAIVCSPPSVNMNVSS